MTRALIAAVAAATLMGNEMPRPKPNNAPTVIRPQPGKQENFLATPADVAIFGGGAGSGKSWAMLMEAARHIHVPGYYGVIFRRITTQIRNQGGLWDESQSIYRSLAGWPRETRLEWRFPSQSRIKFDHLEYESTKYGYQGAALSFVGWDELTQFTKGQFWYLFSRLRSMSGIRPYVRGTCNPDPDSFVADLVEWYVDQDTGYAIPERSGVLRYFTRLPDDQLGWGSSVEEVMDVHHITDPTKIKSFTFVSALVDDNPMLLERNPDYKSNLEALNLVDRERLLHGNWLIRPSAGTIFKREWFPVVTVPSLGGRIVRYWDRAATEVDVKSGATDPDWTVGLRARKAADGFYYVEDVVRFRGTPNVVKTRIRNIAEQDGHEVEVLLARDPAQAGKSEAMHLIQHLEGFKVRAIPETKHKFVRAGPVSAQAEAGNIKLVRAPWNKPLLDELENFGSGKGHDDQADALDGAINALMARAPVPSATWL